MELTCPRCGNLLQPIDDAVPPFCAHCGLPQLRISPDVVQPRQEAKESAPAATAIDWAAALRWIGVAALIGAVAPALLPGALATGGLGGPALLLTPMLAFAVVNLYHRSRPRREVNGAMGACMGAVLGLALGGGVAMLTGVAGFVLRYGYRQHQVADILTKATQQLPGQLAAAGPMPPEVLGFLQSPEFKAGTLLASQVLFALLLVLVGCVCGWIAGVLLKARRERTVG